jgi:hypothetical protein
MRYRLSILTRLGFRSAQPFGNYRGAKVLWSFHINKAMSTGQRQPTGVPKGQKPKAANMKELKILMLHG